jgi:hypothetical protein
MRTGIHLATRPFASSWQLALNELVMTQVCSARARSRVACSSLALAGNMQGLRRDMPESFQ